MFHIKTKTKIKKNRIVIPPSWDHCTLSKCAVSRWETHWHGMLSWKSCFFHPVIPQHMRTQHYPHCRIQVHLYMACQGWKSDTLFGIMITSLIITLILIFSFLQFIPPFENNLFIICSVILLQSFLVWMFFLKMLSTCVSGFRFWV